MTRRLTLAHLTAINLNPPQLIYAASRAGFDAVGIRLIRATENSPGYGLMDDPVLMRETQDALRETKLGVSDVEFVRITPEFDPWAYEAMLDVAAELGAEHVITAPYDDDLLRLSDSLGQFSELARGRGMKPVLEFFPWTPVPDLSTCWRVVQQAGPDAGVLVDSLHFNRSGSSLNDIATIPVERMPFVHLCDAPVQACYSTQDLLHVARVHRLPPGEGEIDLRGFLSALPHDVPLGLEVPMDGDGRRVTERLRHIVKATHNLLDGLAPHADYRDYRPS